MKRYIISDSIKEEGEDNGFDIINKQMSIIREQCPKACNLEDCFDLATAVKVLIDFSWRAVSGKTKLKEELYKDDWEAYGGFIDGEQ
jgi:hypothetical protein